MPGGAFAMSAFLKDVIDDVDVDVPLKLIGHDVGQSLG